MILEIVIAILVVTILTAFLTYILGFFTIIPSSLMILLMFAIAINIVLFVIHRKS